MAGRSFASGHALDLIKRGVEQGTIKLSGASSAHDSHMATEAAKRDAEYLRVLFEALTEGTRD